MRLDDRFVMGGERKEKEEPDLVPCFQLEQLAGQETPGKMKGKIWEVQVKQGAEKGCRRPEDQELIQGTFCSFFNKFFHFYNLLFLNCS